MTGFKPCLRCHAPENEHIMVSGATADTLGTIPFYFCPDATFLAPGPFATALAATPSSEEGAS